MTRQRKEYYSQWAGQFYVAAELTKRGYLVSFPLGNAKETDLMVESPNDSPFRVEVKSLSTKNFWRYKKRPIKNDLYYIFVCLGKIGENPRFYILSSKEVMSEWDSYLNSHPNSDPKDPHLGALFSAIQKYEKNEQWDKLPK